MVITNCRVSSLEIRCTQIPLYTTSASYLFYAENNCFYVCIMFPHTMLTYNIHVIIKRNGCLIINSIMLQVNVGDTQTKQRLTEHVEWLLKLGEGRLEHEPEGAYTDTIRLPHEMCVDSEDALLEHVFGNLNDHLQASTVDTRSLCDYLAERCILTTTNDQVDCINEKIMGKVYGRPVIVKSADSVSETSQAALYPPEFLNSINISGVPPHQMTLKVT